MQAVLTHRYLSNTNFIHKLILAITGSFLIAVAAQIQIPFFPVPLTLQTLAVMLIACIGGSQVGVAAVLAYLLEGASGIPVFAGFSAGIHVLFGPTGGYCLGMLLLAFVAGYLIEQGFGKNFFSVLIALFIGNVLLFAAGLSVLSIYFTPTIAVKVGLLPFLLSGMLKLIFVSMITPYFWQK